MSEALKPLYYLDNQAQKANDAAMKRHLLDLDCYKARKEAAFKKARNKNQTSDLASLLDILEAEEPLARRYVTNAPPTRHWVRFSRRIRTASWRSEMSLCRC
jgi:hypothetical protein